MRAAIVLLAALASLGASSCADTATKIEGNADVYFGLPNPAASTAEWRRWLEALRAERTAALANAGFEPAIYNDHATRWSETSYRQFLLFLYDESFYDRDSRRYRTEAWLGELTARFGLVDSVLLWHAYPRLGFDERGQFDYYRDLPGGLAAVRAQVVDPLHARGVRVFVDYNPWDVSGALDNAAHVAEYRELAELVRALDVDGVMLDTLTEVPAALRDAIRASKPGVVFAPERRPPDHDLSYSRQSWAQWYDLGGDRPSIYRQKWLEPRHQPFAIRRWDEDRRGDIVYSFFNAAGQLIWDNVFGSWNPYSPEDRLLLAQTGAVLAEYGEELARAEWLPLLPTGVAGLDANLFRGADGSAIVLFRNRTDRELAFDIARVGPPGQGRDFFAFWEPSQGRVELQVRVPARGTQALVLDSSARALRALEKFRAATRAAQAAAAKEAGSYDASTPEPKPLFRAGPALGADASMARLPGGDFMMTITHKKRECGCYSLGTERSALWGWYFEDLVTHRIATRLGPFAIRRTAVTNAEYLEFVQATGYSPRVAENFLRQLPRNPDGSLPRELGPELAALPVTYVSLDDARAYARWKGQRLPTEAEWQWAAEGAGLAHAWPWGNDDGGARDARRVNLSGRLERADGHPAGATPQGLLGLTGNAWELTESEYSDGHTRFVMLRGGSYLPEADSEWIAARGARPNGYHSKYILLDDGLDRSASVSFRTAADL